MFACNCNPIYQLIKPTPTPIDNKKIALMVGFSYIGWYNLGVRVTGMGFELTTHVILNKCKFSSKYHIVSSVYGTPWFTITCKT
jgi:hypothetical protein